MQPPNLRKCDCCARCIYFRKLSTWGEGECVKYPHYQWAIQPEEVCDSFKESPTDSDH
jgi:hypothetical protein